MPKIVKPADRELAGPQHFKPSGLMVHGSRGLRGLSNRAAFLRLGPRPTTGEVAVQPHPKRTDHAMSNRQARRARKQDKRTDKALEAMSAYLDSVTEETYSTHTARLVILNAIHSPQRVAELNNPCPCSECRENGRPE